MNNDVERNKSLTNSPTCNLINYQIIRLRNNVLFTVNESESRVHVNLVFLISILRSTVAN